MAYLAKYFFHHRVILVLIFARWRQRFTCIPDSFEGVFSEIADHSCASSIENDAGLARSHRLNGVQGIADFINFKVDINCAGSLSQHSRYAWRRQLPLGPRPVFAIQVATLNKVRFASLCSRLHSNRLRLLVATQRFREIRCKMWRLRKNIKL